MTIKNMDALNDPRRTVRLDDVRALHPRFRRQDGIDIYLQQQLETVMATVYERRLPELQIASGGVVPIRSTVPLGQDVFTYKMYEHTGFAIFFTSSSWRDIPTVATKATSATGHIQSMGVKYGYNLWDVEKAANASRNSGETINLDTFGAIAARRAIEQKINTVGATGEEALNLKGLLNHPNMTVADAAQGGTTSQYKWLSTGGKNAAEMLLDLDAVVDGMLSATNEVERPDRLFLPPAYYRLAQRFLIATGAAGSESVINVFRGNNPEIVQVGQLRELATASATGGNAILGLKYDPQALWFEIPMPFTQRDIAQNNVETEILCEARVGGIIAVYPLSMIRLDFPA